MSMNRTMKVRVSGRDLEAQRAANRLAPRISNLVPRIAELFAPHRRALIVTGILVVISAGLTVLPPLLTRSAFDQGLFPKSGHLNFPILVEIVAVMVFLYVAAAALGVWQTYLTSSVGSRVMGSMRVR